ncbi:OmcA/MtrC family decaheme c-type cytochrome [Ferrimonas sediminicola]|nr:OmcA/MtrC family decaheme c-type cytochrome [Ferrimonas sediminicola]
MMKTPKAPLALLIASALMMGGCGDGEDGKDGQPGQTGQPGNPGEPGSVGLHIDMAGEAIAQIKGATYQDGIIAVEFELTNSQGVGLFGLDGNNPFHDFRFSLAQLEVDGDLKRWQSLLNETTNDAGTTFEQGFEKLKDCPKCLTDNNDGSYSYRFHTDLLQWQDPAGVAFDPALTQRLAIEMQFEYDSGHELAENAHYDWIPASGGQEGVETRELVTMETCYTCHQPDSLKAHGGRRLDLENCQACHNGLVSDPEGVSVELGHMVHAIHMGPERQGKDEQGTVVPMPYTIAGYHGPHAFDYPAFPTKPFMDCSVCHTEDDSLADSELWLKDANANACIGCHTDSPVQHNSAKSPELACTDCHSGVDHRKHGAPYEAAAGYAVSVSNIEINADHLLELDLQVTDAEGGLVSIDEIYQQGYSNPYVVVSWDVERDYPEQLVTLEGEGFSEGTTYEHRRFSLKGDGSTTYADGTFHLTTEKVKRGITYTLDLPADIAQRTLEILPLVKVCFEENSPVRTDCSNEGAYPAYVQSEPVRTILADGDAQVPERRAIIDEASCFGCHSKEFYHDSNGANCIACHTNDKKLVDVEVDHQPTGYLKPSSFMYKAHKAKGHDNGHGGSGTLLKTDCLTCHSAEQGWGGLDYGFELGRNAGSALAVPSTVKEKDVAETWYASPDVGACMSCHQKYLSDAAMSHMISNGGYFGDDKAQAQAAQEACAVCHTPDKVMAHHGHKL